jgi:hypothetical protein
LIRLVRIGLQARHLPADLAEHLSLSHHRVLLSVADGQHKQHIARLAVRNPWTVEQLQAQITSEKPAVPHPLGRPTNPAPLKWLGAVQRAILADATSDWPLAVAHMRPEDQAQLKAELWAVQSQIQARQPCLRRAGEELPYGNC